MSFCVNTVVAKLLTNYVVQPDYSELIQEIGTNRFCSFGDRLVKILCCTPTHVVFAERLSFTAPATNKVCTMDLGDWERTFVRWYPNDPRLIPFESFRVKS